MTGIGLTWQKVRARSERTTPRGMTTYCLDCKLHYDAAKVPCLKHTLPDERARRAKALGVVR